MKLGQEVIITSSSPMYREVAGAKGFVTGTVSVGGTGEAPLGWVTIPGHESGLRKTTLHPEGVQDGDWALTNDDLEVVAEPEEALV